MSCPVTNIGGSLQFFAKDEEDNVDIGDLIKMTLLQLLLSLVECMYGDDIRIQGITNYGDRVNMTQR